MMTEPNGLPRRVWPLPRIEVVSLADARETRAVALYTSGPAWEAIGGVLALPVVWRAEPTDAAEERFVALADAMPDEAEVIYAVGGGLPVDAAKIAMARRGLPLVAVPTALSVDAHLTPASGIRRDGCVFYQETGAPERLLIDWEVIAAAPSWVRAAGLGDVLSIATGIWDWRFAEQQGRNPPGERWIAYVADMARILLAEAIRVAESAGAGDQAGLARLLQLLALEVQLCSLIGHSRPEEGSEHAFAYSVENLVGLGLPHGDLVGPGIVAMAAAQGQETAPLRAALEASGARLDRIPAHAARATLSGLPAYAERHRLPFSIAHTLDDRQREAALRSLW
ncbi:MAG: iron-containing alcohol dehydrogenase [Thermomicrobiales bacterium]|nr:iron-containing alcohol dehydrogenase [Thermomicrobiales bacterium]